jgi:transposase
MRKGHDGLAALVQRQMGQDVYSGHLFVFVSRRGDRIKILTWDNGGFVLWYKRLERGRFRVPKVDATETVLGLESAQLSMLLDGIDYSRVRKPLRWSPPRLNEKNRRKNAEKAVSRGQNVFHSGA